ncbi:MAG: biopolymer transporter Tol [Ignavibacteria bacterium]|jgi:Tol biopolymer transport system component|nr:biopolymer transporter Tol [Ignavibacteria bacterium]MCU7502217.1 biopolymer transporter Tol [Ignavibacteria bacterium]MCU7517434.1 biopolymer transporter Tol [Ignavibacteria bacterium]
MKKLFGLLLACILLLSRVSLAQFTEFHPELNWLTLKGEHVQVHYHEETERTARAILKIADEVWGPITSLYQYEPETVHFVVKDIDDYSNGATYFFDNKIEIWSSALDFDLRGTHNWLRNVISHEFTHMVQIQSAMKLGRTLPAFYFQFMNYEDKRRPDILYGFPNVIASYPIATINVPAWFAEGSAQYMRKEFNYDNWDSHRDMILRSYALEGGMMTWNQMGVFSKTSLGNESVYNAGFALTTYIAQKYGEDKLRKITQALGKLKNFTMDAAFKDVLGKSGDEIYDEWKESLTKDYKRRTEQVEQNVVKGKEIAGEGFGNFYPVFSEDGTKIIYLSNKQSDYFSPSNVYSYDLKTGKDEMVTFNVRSTISWIKGENKIVYSKLSEDNPSWTNIHDIYVYDLNEKEETRLTHGLRANQPFVSHDGSKIVFVYQKDGTSNLGLVDIKGKGFKRLTFFENGEQVFNPRFSNDDQSVVFDCANANGRDIASVKTDASGLEYLLQTKADERNPVFGPDGKLYYSSDESGIFNIYSMDLRTKATEQLTNVIGGAFMPSVDQKGNIVYAGYSSTGYKILFLDTLEQKKVDPLKRYIPHDNAPLSADKSNGDINGFGINNLIEYDDNKLPDTKSTPYKGAFTKVSFFPFVRYDNYSVSNNPVDKIKPGVYVTSNDMLDRFSFFAGASLNRRMERDLFLELNYRNKLPLLFNMGIKPELSLQLYSVSRDAKGEFPWDEADNKFIPVDVTYDLFEMDLAAKHRIFARGNDLEFRFIYSTYTTILGSFVLPSSPDVLQQKTKDTYLIGRNFQVKYHHEMLFPYVDSDINPIGRELDLQYNYEMNKFNLHNRYAADDGIVKSQYDNFDFNRLELNWKEHIPLWKGHTLTAQFRGAAILSRMADTTDFFDYYLGGLVGMKSYPFYAVSGKRLGWLNLTYRFPLFKNIDYRLGFLYLDKIFLSVFGDFGNAWEEKMPKLSTFKKGAGTELRVKLESFYMFPTSLFFSAAYSFDRADRMIDNELVRYGKEWQFYGGILFDFNL